MKFNDDFKMYEPKTVAEMMSFVGKKVKFLYHDYDGGSISGVITIHSIELFGKDEYIVNCTIHEGESLIGFRYYSKTIFKDGNVFNECITAGDDMDQLLIVEYDTLT